jgi:hypothetical protein
LLHEGRSSSRDHGKQFTHPSYLKFRSTPYAEGGLFSRTYVRIVHIVSVYLREGDDAVCSLFGISLPERCVLGGILGGWCKSNLVTLHGEGDIY